MDVMRCPRCGSENLVFAFADFPGARADLRLQAECERCGPVEVAENDVDGEEEEGEAPRASVRFDPPSADSSPRRGRG
jgi:ribosomal protein S27AE